MHKKVILVISITLLIIIVFGTYRIFFADVSFNCVYNGIVDFSNVNQENYNIFTKQDSYIFTSKEQWDQFKNTYLSNGQIPDIKLEDGQILLTYTDLSKDIGGNIYDISKIKKNFLTLDIFLKEKGTVSNLKGFVKNAELKNVMIHKVYAGTLARIYTLNSK